MVSLVLQVAFRCLSVPSGKEKLELGGDESSPPPVEHELKTLAWSLMRWKTLLCVLLKWSSSVSSSRAGRDDDKRLKMSKRSAVEILEAWVNKALFLVSALNCLRCNTSPTSKAISSTNWKLDSE